MNSYRDLKAWQIAMEVAENALQLTEKFPRSKQLSLGYQIDKAAVSIPSNIAEGYSRRTAKDRTQFYYIAKGSLSELETQLILSTRLKYIPREEMETLWEKLQEVGKILHGLIRYTKS